VADWIKKAATLITKLEFTITIVDLRMVGAKSPKAQTPSRLASAQNEIEGTLEDPVP
jgi:hypothetical protein